MTHMQKTLMSEHARKKLYKRIIKQLEGETKQDAIEIVCTWLSDDNLKTMVAAIVGTKISKN